MTAGLWEWSQLVKRLVQLGISGWSRGRHRLPRSPDTAGAPWLMILSPLLYWFLEKPSLLFVAQHLYEGKLQQYTL